MIWWHDAKMLWWHDDPVIIFIKLTLGTLDWVRQWKQSSWGVLGGGLWSHRRHLHRDGEHCAKRHQKATQKLQHFTCKSANIGKLPRKTLEYEAAPTLCDHARAWLVNTDWGGARARWLLYRGACVRTLRRCQPRWGGGEMLRSLFPKELTCHRAIDRGGIFKAGQLNGT